MSLNLDGAFQTTEQKIDVLIKKLLNRPFTNTGLPYFQEPGPFVRPFVLQDQVWGEDVPVTVPTDLLSVTLDDSGNTLQGSYVGNTSDTSPVIKRYDKILLEFIPGSEGNDMMAFKAPKDDISSYSILKNMIPFNFDAVTGSYEFELFSRQGFTYTKINLGDGAFYIDPDSGILTVTEAVPGITSSNPPYISYYRYIGLLGLPLKANVSDTLRIDGNASTLTYVTATFVQSFKVTVGLSGASFVIHINDEPQKRLVLVEGHTYLFDLRDLPPSHPFFISRSDTTSTSISVYSTGVIGNNNSQDSDYPYLEFEVPTNFYGKLYYQTNVNSFTNMGGEILVVGPSIADGDHDTYIHVEAEIDEDKIRMVTRGVERLIIDEVGEVYVVGNLKTNTFETNSLDVTGSITLTGEITKDGLNYVTERVKLISKMSDLDQDTYIEFEQFSDQDVIHLFTKGLERMFIREDGLVNVTNTFEANLFNLATDINLGGDIYKNGQLYVQQQIDDITKYSDRDGDTYIEFENTPNDNIIHFHTAFVEQMSIRSNCVNITICLEAREARVADNIHVGGNIFKNGLPYIAEQVGNISKFSDADIDTYIEFEETTDDDIIHLYAGGIERLFIENNIVNVTGDLETNNSIVNNDIIISGDIYKDGDLYVKQQVANISIIGDFDRDTYIELEQTPDEDKIHFYTVGVEWLHINKSGVVNVTNILEVNTITVDDNINIHGDLFKNGLPYVAEQVGNISKFSDADIDTYIEFEETPDDDIIHLYAGGIERLFIEDNIVNVTGNLETNNSIVNNDIYVSGDIYKDGNLYVKQQVANISIVGDFDRDTYIELEETNDEDIIHFYTDGVEQFRINESGVINVSYYLQSKWLAIDNNISVSGDILKNGELYVSKQVANISKFSDADQDTYIEFEQTPDDDIIRLFASGEEAMLLSNGNNGVNVTIPGILTVEEINSNVGSFIGNITILGDLIKNGLLYTDTLSNGSRLEDGDDDTYIVVEDTPDSDEICMVTNGTTRLCIRSDGLVSLFGNLNIEGDLQNYGLSLTGNKTSLRDTDRNTYIETEETPDEDILRFYTNGTERMYIAGDGNITMISPLYVDLIKSNIVNVSGDINFTGQLLQNGSIYQADIIYTNFTTHVASSIDDVWLKFQDNMNNIDNIYAIGELGNEVRIGIGVNQPLKALHIQDGDVLVEAGSVDIGSTLRVEGISSLSQVFAQHSNTTNLTEPIVRVFNEKLTSNVSLISVESSNVLQPRVDMGFKTLLSNTTYKSDWAIGTGRITSSGGYESFFIRNQLNGQHYIDIETNVTKANTSGIVNIGTGSSGRVDLVVTGDFLLNGSATIKELNLIEIISTEADEYLFKNNNSEIMMIIEYDNNQTQVGIGIDDPQCTLHVNGSVCAKTFKASSDLSLKNTIKPLNIDFNSLEVINQLNPVSFHWNDYSENINNNTNYGLIAQEVINILPDIVSIDNSNIHSIEYNQLIGILIQSVKDLNKKVNKLEQIINKNI
jgi:succinate dehydrogenase flavin-adding protein (antitoxin of CptAB toxin-antitoxin module)